MYPNQDFLGQNFPGQDFPGKDFPCTLSEFAGPFELLLSLAAKEEIDTRKILIAQVISQFIEKGSQGVEDKATFAHNASWLHVLKSLALSLEKLELPNFAHEEQDFESLSHAFDELRSAQQIGVLLEQKQESRRGQAFRPIQPLPKAQKETSTLATIEDLKACFQKLLKKSTPQKHLITQEEISLEEEKTALSALLILAPHSFISLFESLARKHQISRFLAILELLKQGLIRIFIEAEVLYVAT